MSSFCDCCGKLSRDGAPCCCPPLVSGGQGRSGAELTRDLSGCLWTVAALIAAATAFVGGSFAS